MVGDSDSDELAEQMPVLMRMTSMQIGSEYSFVAINPEKLYSLLSSKIVNVKERFEYIHLDQGLVLDSLRKNHFLVDDACVKLQDLVLVMMEKNEGSIIEES